MIIYQENCRTFIDQCYPKTNTGKDISDYVSERMHLSGINYFDASEVKSWSASLPVVANALIRGGFDGDIDVAIEYKINQNKERIDFILYGRDDIGNKNVVIIELKQWSSASSCRKPDFVHAFGGGGEDDYWHPSYQAYNYANILMNFNQYIQDNDVHLHTCSFMHNMPEAESVLLDDADTYPLVASTSPAFLKDDMQKLIDFMKKYVKKPDKELLYYIDNSTIRPSPMLSNMLSSALKGNAFFSYDDSQAKAVATIVQTVQDCLYYDEKRTIIVRGGPGTGKSIVALNVLGQLVHPKKGKSVNAAYFTCNSAPRELYSEKLINEDYSKQALKSLFKSPISMAGASADEFACALVDEAHRVYAWKGGTGLKSDVNLLDEIIKGSRVNVFFIDEDQAVTKDDYVTIDRIREFADKNRSRVIEGPELTLTSQFRVLGGDDYIRFIRTFLGYENSVTKYTPKNYDFKVFDSPSEMREAIRQKNFEDGMSRLVAGYDYEWVTKDNFASDEYDIVLEGGKFKAKWNMRKNNYSWLNDPNSTEEVGCIHTAQGLDMNYCGVIIGKDLTYENGHLCFHKEMNAKSDRSSGIRTADDELAAHLIRNTYNVLLTRGMKGTYVYCEDKTLSDYLKSLFIR